MFVADRHTFAELQQLARRQKEPRPRLGLQAVVLAKEGRTAKQIAHALGLGLRTAQQYVQDYNTGGVEALRDKRTGEHDRGRHHHLAPEQEQWLCQRLDAGPLPEDGVCSLRGADVRRIIEQKAGVLYSLSGVYDLLHRLGCSCLMPRPRHPKADPAAQEAFKKTPPRC